MRTERLVPEFVEFVPTNPAPGVLYVSTEYCTAVHACCCGCGRKVVTPLGPTDWRVSARGTTVSVYPSVGNWNFPCQSHYWIWDGAVVWAEQWTPEKIAAGRRADQRRKDAYYRQQAKPTPQPTQAPSLWERLVRAFLAFWR
jgi:hypothetical protein